MNICPVCGHEEHGSKVCEQERPDVYTSGYAPMAPGPCECTGEDPAEKTAA